MHYELVVFDCDGVLVDSERIALRIDVEMLAELGWQLSEEEVITRFMGRSESVMREAIERHLGHPPPADWREREHERYRRAWDSELTAVDGVLDALERISVPVCVASSSEPEDLRYKLELTGLGPRFDGAMFTAAEVKRGKPAPDLFLHAAETMGAEPSRCAVVEDSAYGVAAGRAAGMDVYAYLGGLARPETLRGDATVLFEDMRRLPELLESAGG